MSRVSPAPYQKWAEAVEDADYSPMPRAIMIDDGAVVVQGVDGTPATLTLAANIWHPMVIKQVVGTGTTATNVWVAW